MATKKDNNKNKANLITALKRLRDDIGWKIIVKALKENIKQAEARLHGDIKLEEGETIKEWQKIRSDRMMMIELPDIILKENEEKEKFDPNLDPFD